MMLQPRQTLSQAQPRSSSPILFIVIIVLACVILLGTMIFVGRWFVKRRERKNMTQAVNTAVQNYVAHQQQGSVPVVPGQQNQGQVAVVVPTQYYDPPGVAAAAAPRRQQQQHLKQYPTTTVTARTARGGSYEMQSPTPTSTSTSTPAGAGAGTGTGTATSAVVVQGSSTQQQQQQQPTTTTGDRWG